MLLQHTPSISVLRKILFAVVHLPKEMPNYWQTIKDFAGTELSVSELQTAVENLQYLNAVAFSTDDQLLSSMCLGEGGNSIGIVLVSSKQKCRECGARLSTRADRPRNMVLYTESSGTLPATHYRKVCSHARHGCSYVQHYGFHSHGKLHVIPACSFQLS